MIIDTRISSDFIEEEDDVIDLANITDYCDCDFSSEIKKRGQEYFYGGKVISCIQCDTNTFVGKVKGSNSHVYSVEVNIDNRLEPIYTCTCPCTYPCKHVYAVLVAIENGKYSVAELKPEIQMNKKSLNEIIELIPATDLKEYILSSLAFEKVSFDVASFNKAFNKYLPLQSYEYYYNQLYNSIILDYNYWDLTNTYMDNVKQYISDQNFQEAFKIIKVTIESYAESNKLDLMELIDLFPRIGMYLRIAYRKGNDNLKLEVDNWKEKMKDTNYYDNYYLEDMFLTVGV